MSQQVKCEKCEAVIIKRADGRIERRISWDKAHADCPALKRPSEVFK